MKEFVASADLTITRDGDSYILTGTEGRVVEIPSAVVLFAVRFSEAVSAPETPKQEKRRGR